MFNSTLIFAAKEESNYCRRIQTVPRCVVASISMDSLAKCSQAKQHVVYKNIFSILCSSETYLI